MYFPSLIKQCNAFWLASLHDFWGIYTPFSPWQTLFIPDKDHCSSCRAKRPYFFSYLFSCNNLISINLPCSPLYKREVTTFSPSSPKHKGTSTLLHPESPAKYTFLHCSALSLDKRSALFVHVSNFSRDWVIRQVLLVGSFSLSTWFTPEVTSHLTAIKPKVRQSTWGIQANEKNHTTAMNSKVCKRINCLLGERTKQIESC